jgi:hypothetical protein
VHRRCRLGEVVECPEERVMILLNAGIKGVVLIREQNRENG